MASSSDNPSSDENWTSFDQDSAIFLQLKCILQANLPFDAFEHSDLLSFLQPNYKWVSSTALKHEAFNQYLHVKKDLINYFKKLQSKVSLTIHAWNTNGSYFSPYICITCHFIDPKTWKTSKRIIALEQTDYPYKAKNVYNLIMRSISEFQIKHKIMSITFDDSARYYPQAIEMLKRELNPICNGIFFQTKCISHILNSMVQSSLDYVSPVVTKFKNLFIYVFRSFRTKQFKRFALSNGKNFVDYISSSIPIPDEWDTIYKTLRLLVKQKSLLVEFYASCGETEIDDNDWEIIESLVDILKVFYKCMGKLSDFYDFDPITTRVLDEILVIASTFNYYKTEPFWEPLILELQFKLLEYYKTMPLVFTCASALDPHIGIGGVAEKLEYIGVSLGLDTNNMNGSDQYEDYARVSMTKCSTALHEVFDYYESMYRSRSNDIISNISNELELYIKTDFPNVLVSDEFKNCDMLEWWKNKGRHQYPILGEMVRDLLTVQASAMDSEFVYCLNGRVLDEMSMYKLSPRWLKMRSFLKVHFGEEGQKVNLVEGGSYESESEDSVSFYDSSDEDRSYI